MNADSKLFPGIDSSHITTITNRLDLFKASLDKQGLTLDIKPETEKELIRAVFFSEYIAEGITKDPGILIELIKSKDLYSIYKSDTYVKKIENNLPEDVTDVQSVKRTLLYTKLYETIRIAWRDLNNLAALEETLEDLSCLAEAIVNKVVESIYGKISQIHGLPVNSDGKTMGLIVLGMGKLGARELNFSSDIDLIFVYPEDGYTSGEKQISNVEFFTKLCRNFTVFFSPGSHETNFYRVDTRLRPFGDSGPIVMSAEAFEYYYQTQGREWERYAMIKARPIAGDIKAGSKVLDSLNSFIYRRYFDYGTYDSFRDMKQRITLQVKNKRLEHNIKLGAGGIREIEFFGQLFQLIRGGVEPRLQERKILNVLDVLKSQKVITPAIYKELKDAYVFLRLVENRLQAYADLQTHDIPQKKERQLPLAISMGYKDWKAFEQVLSGHMEKVHYHFSQLLITNKDEDRENDLESLKEMWTNINDPQFRANSVVIQGFENSEKVLSLLRSLATHPNTQRMSQSGRQRLARLVPMLVQKAGEHRNADDILLKLIDLIITIERRTCYLSLLVENHTALDALITLTHKSPWIITFLSSHPALLDELVHPDTLYSPPGKDALEKEMQERMSGINTADMEYLVEELCIFRQVNTLRVAAADISGHYPLMKVSDHLTYIAETILTQVLTSCWEIVTSKFGIPEEIKGTGMEDCGFAIVAYGKVGGYEMGYKSDIDLVFLHKKGAGFTSGTDKSVDATTFYSNLGQRIINALTIHSAAGTLYGADMRLRPGGDAGMIVSSIDAFEDYMENDAWTWEFQALIRARFVAGDNALCKEFERIRQRQLTRNRDWKSLKTEVGSMREKMRTQRLKPEKEVMDLKQSRGGIVDIEFLVQFFILKYAYIYPEIIKWTDNVRCLEQLERYGVVTTKEKTSLHDSYLAMRKAIHYRNLQERSQKVPEAYFKKYQGRVIELYKYYLGY